jgi:hypothetical protein
MYSRREQRGNCLSRGWHPEDEGRGGDSWWMRDAEGLSCRRWTYTWNVVRLPFWPPWSKFHVANGVEYSVGPSPDPVMNNPRELKMACWLGSDIRRGQRREQRLVYVSQTVWFSSFRFTTEFLKTFSYVLDVLVLSKIPQGSRPEDGDYLTLSTVTTSSADTRK